MKKMILSLSLAVAAVLFAGCVSVETVKGADLNKQSIANSGKTVAHVNVQNWYKNGATPSRQKFRRDLLPSCTIPHRLRGARR